jgi:hypothetical protein
MEKLRTHRRRYIALVGLVALVGVFVLARPLLRVTPSSNDNYSNATVIDGSPFSDSVDTTLATTDFADPSPSCGNASRLKTVWYQYTAGSNATIVVDTIGSTYDTTLSAFTGAPGSFAAVACNDDASGNTPVSKFALHVIAGTTYSFMVSQFGLPDGMLSLHATVYPVPPNDNFQNATIASSLPFTDTGADYEATTEVTDPIPSCGDNDKLKTVWYRYTPSVTGTVAANTTGSSYDTILSVYTGSQGSLTEVACNDDATSAVPAQVSFTATAGTTYSLMVSAFAGDAGTLTFHIDAPKRRAGQITSQ